MILIYQSAIILSFVSVILALLLLFSLDFRIAEKSYFFIMLSIQIFLYTFGYFLELTSDNLFEALYAVRVQYIGLPFILTSSYLLLRDIYDRKSFSRPKKFFSTPFHLSFQEECCLIPILISFIKMSSITQMEPLLMLL